ncbi:MAG: hypothetical protein ACOYLE_02775 [Bacteroidales bacterium]
MKKILIIFLFLFSFTSVFSQYGQIANAPLNKTDSIALNLKYTKNCIASFHRQHQVATVATFVGGVIILGSVSPLIITNSQNTDSKGIIAVGTTLGCAIAVVGMIMQIDSYKWLKRSGLQPIFEPNRLGVLIKF